MTVLAPQEPAREWAAHEVMVTEPSVIRRAIGAAAVGNITEWYDFGVYAYFEPTIKKVFFADLGDTAGTIATFGLFAVAFLVRPFGGMFFGPLADRIGRNKVLATTMVMMALGTFAIGCIPSHEEHRPRGAAVAAGGPAGAGVLDRWRVRQRDDLHRRVRPRPAPRLPRQLAGVRHLYRLSRWAPSSSRSPTPR